MQAFRGSIGCMETDLQHVHRRRFLTGALAGGAGLALGPGVWTRVYAQDAVPGTGPYGSIDEVEPDANGLLLPAGFSSRVLARSAEEVADTGYTWHYDPDGGATFPTDDGGWIYVSNSEEDEVGTGGVSGLRFDASGELVDAYRVLEGSRRNCAGGPTPWGAWLSCEEYDDHDAPIEGQPIAGRVWETDPTGRTEAVAHEAMGLFSHEAVAVDPDGERLYLTEDQPDGLLYRYTPDEYPDLSAGTLEAAQVDGTSLRWLPVPDPSAAEAPTRAQVPDATPFLGGEGIWFHDGWVYFTTKFDDRVHALEPATDSYRVVYDAAQLGDAAPLRGVDNITAEAGTGDLYVAEDGGRMQIVLITPEGEVAPFLRILGQDDSEVTGPAFSPDGTRLYFSSQRGTAGEGITYEVTGPFRGAGADDAAAAPSQSLGTVAERAAGGTSDPTTDDDGAPIGLIAGGAAVLAAGAGAAIVALRRRGSA